MNSGGVGLDGDSDLNLSSTLNSFEKSAAGLLSSSTDYGGSGDYSGGPGLTSVGSMGSLSGDGDGPGVGVDIVNNYFTNLSNFTQTSTAYGNLRDLGLGLGNDAQSGSNPNSMTINPTSILGLGLNCAKEFVEGCVRGPLASSLLPPLSSAAAISSSSSSSSFSLSGIVPSVTANFENAAVGLGVLGLGGSTTQGTGDLSLLTHESDVGMGDEGAGPTVTSWILVIIMTILIVLTIVGNVLVCLSVILVRKLRKPQNYLLVSLATSDLFVALFVMPLASISEFHESRWTLNSALCDLWVSADVLCCTASILNLCAISLDRHSAITAPFDYSARSTPRRMLAVIFIVWLVSACVSLPPVLLLKNEHIDNGIHICRVSQNKWYQLYATMASFYVPLVVMVVVYVKILRVVADKKKEMTWKKQTSFITSTSPQQQLSQQQQQQQHQNQNQNQTSIAMTMTNSSCSSSSPLKSQCQLSQSNMSVQQAPPSRERELTSTVTPMTTTTVCSINKLPGKNPTRTTKLSHKSNSTLTNTNANVNANLNSIAQQQQPPPSTSSFGLFKKSSAASSEGGGGGSSGSNVNSNGASSYLLPPVTLHRVKKGKLFSGLKEHKASTTLGIIMSAFIICWLPFFVLALVRPIFPVEIPGWVSSLFNWLGWANSALNPVIYATLNRDFRRPFKEILCFRCSTLDSLMRKEFYLQQFGDPV